MGALCGSLRGRERPFARELVHRSDVLCSSPGFSPSFSALVRSLADRVVFAWLDNPSVSKYRRFLYLLRVCGLKSS